MGWAGGTGHQLPGTGPRGLDMGLVLCRGHCQLWSRVGPSGEALHPLLQVQSPSTRYSLGKVGGYLSEGRWGTGSGGGGGYLSDDGGLDGPDLVAPGARRLLDTLQTSSFLGERGEGILVGGGIALLFGI